MSFYSVQKIPKITPVSEIFPQKQVDLSVKTSRILHWYQIRRKIQEKMRRKKDNPGKTIFPKIPSPQQKWLKYSRDLKPAEIRQTLQGKMYCKHHYLKIYLLQIQTKTKLHCFMQNLLSPSKEMQRRNTYPSFRNFHHTDPILIRYLSSLRQTLSISRKIAIWVGWFLMGGRVTNNFKTLKYLLYNRVLI